MYPVGYCAPMMGKPFCFLPPASTLRAFSLGHHHTQGRGAPSMTRCSSYFPFHTRSLSGKHMFEPIRNKLPNTFEENPDYEPEGGATKSSCPTRFTSTTGRAGETCRATGLMPIVSPASSVETKKSYACPQCKYSTDRKNNLKRHVITMHFDCDRKLECCGTVFRSKAKLREHVTLFHKNGYRCLVCARMFCRKALLRRHMAVHSGKKDFHCEFCSYATSHKSNLERHQKVHAKSSASRFVYSHRKLVATFERKLYTIDDINVIGTDYKSTEHDIEDTGIVTSDINMETSETNVIAEPNRDLTQPIGVKDFIKSDGASDENIMEHPEESMVEIDLSENEKCQNIKELHGQTVTENTIEKYSLDFPLNLKQIESNKYEHFGMFTEMFRKYYRNESETENIPSDVVNKENLQIDEAGTKHNNNRCSDITRKKCSLRLCGLPYRCSSCGSRFESQDKLVHHACTVPGVDKITTVSLVALILKQGNKLVSF